MARNDHARAAGRRSLGELCFVVQDVNAHTGQSQCTLLGNARRPLLGIVVAAYGVERGQRTQLPQNLRRADVSRVNDAVRVLEKGLCLGS
jgi:hypothetical protein